MTSITYIGNFLSSHGLNPTYSEALVPRLRQAGIPVAAASTQIRLSARLLDMLRHVLTTPKKSCVIIDLYSGPRAFRAAGVIARICRTLGRKYIIVLHGGDLPKRIETSLSSLLAIFSGAAQVISPSNYLASQFQQFVNVTVIPNALDLSQYPYRHRRQVAPRFVYLRAFHRYYDPLTAIQAFHAVSLRYPGARLRMIGPDEDGTLAAAKRMVADFQLDACVQFSGRIPKSEIPLLGEEADIFLNSSRVDNTPLSMIEGMAMGMCTVATTAGGLPYIVKDNESGLLVRPGDHKAMAAAMLRILEEPALAAKLSQNARRTVESMDWSAVLPLWLRTIHSVVT
jgi:glycosyltransferase involved in cell wall biosynthesis